MIEEKLLNALMYRKLKLTEELERVSNAIDAFEKSNHKIKSQFESIEIPKNYNTKSDYSSKILYVLQSSAEPLLIDEIISKIQEIENHENVLKLSSNIKFNISMLVKYERVKKIPFNKKKKYSILNLINCVL